MKIIILHSADNPQQIIPMDAEDFSVALPIANGSAVRLKSSDATFQVHEKPEEILSLLPQ